jgi:hypothetical protein
MLNKSQILMLLDMNDGGLRVTTRTPKEISIGNRADKLVAMGYATKMMSKHGFAEYSITEEASKLLDAQAVTSATIV